MIENIVIGEPIIEPLELFAFDKEDWERIEKDKTLFTKERYLPRIMKDIGIVNSVSEVRRNRPELCVNLDKIDFIHVKWGKKHLFIMIGE